MKFHLNVATGQTGACKAVKRACPVGDADVHFENEDQARAAYEVLQHGSFGPSVKAAKIIEKIAVEPYVGGYDFSLTAKDMASVTQAEWADLSLRFDGESKAAETVYRAEEKRLQGSNSSLEDRKALEDLRVVWATASLRFHLASKAATLMSDRVENDVHVPPGHDVVKAVYDLGGRFIAPAQDTRVSPQTVTLPDGSKAQYRESRASDPEKKKATEGAKGFYTGTAVVPVGISLDSRRGVRVKPAYAALRSNPELARSLDSGK